MNELSQQEAFVQTYYDEAVKTQVEYGVPLLIILAQAALESSWKEIPGNKFFSESKKYNCKNENDFSSPGKKAKCGSRSASFESAYDSFTAHAVMLKKNFPVAFQYRKNPDEFIRSVQRDHEIKYENDPQYAQRVISVMALIKILITDLKLNNAAKERGKRR